jgi:hypothetical protein
MFIEFRPNESSGAKAALLTTFPKPDTEPAALVRRY